MLIKSSHIHLTFLRALIFSILIIIIVVHLTWLFLSDFSRTIGNRGFTFLCYIALFLDFGRNAARRVFIVAMSVDRLRWFSDWWHDVGEVLIVSGVRINAQSSKLDG